MKKFIFLITFILMLSVNSFSQSLCGCSTERGVTIAGRVSDIYGLGAPNFKVIANKVTTNEDLWTYTDVNGYYSFGDKQLYPPSNLPLERCTGYNVYVDSLYVTPYLINVYTNPTESFCQDPENVNFMYNY